MNKNSVTNIMAMLVTLFLGGAIASMIVPLFGLFGYALILVCIYVVALTLFRGIR